MMVIPETNPKHQIRNRIQPVSYIENLTPLKRQYACAN
jgi:hypothetical protein